MFVAKSQLNLKVLPMIFPFHFEIFLRVDKTINPLVVVGIIGEVEGMREE